MHTLDQKLHTNFKLAFSPIFISKLENVHYEIFNKKYDIQVLVMMFINDKMISLFINPE
jgi:hypothetical protein